MSLATPPAQSTTGLSQLIDSLVNAAIIFAFTVLLFWILATLRIKRYGGVPESIAEIERMNLKEAVALGSKKEEMRIYLRPFWKIRSWNSAQRYTLLRPMIKDGTFQRYLVTGWVGYIVDFSYSILKIPPRLVILNSLDWNRMAHGGDTYNFGDINGGNNQFGGQGNLQQITESTKLLAPLIEALLADRAEASPAVQERIDEVARGISDAHERGDLGKVSRWVQAAASLAGNSDNLLTHTSSIIHRFL